MRELKELAEWIVGQRQQISACKRRLRALTRGHEAIEAQAPAVGLVTACVLWVCLGDPHAYGSAAAYRKAMGLNLVEHSSGAFKGRLRISKRGQRLARKWLYFGALRWMRDPSVRPWVLPKKARDGGRGMRAMVGGHAPPGAGGVERGGEGRGVRRRPAVPRHAARRQAGERRGARRRRRRRRR